MIAALDGVPMVAQGYDQSQVDEYVARMSTLTRQSQAALADVEQRLREAQHRSEQAERALADGATAAGSLSGLGAKVEQTLRLAQEAGDLARGHGHREAEGIVSAAQLEAGDITNRAAADAQAMRSSAETDGARLLGAARDEGAQLVADASRDAGATRALVERETVELRTATVHHVSALRTGADEEIAKLRVTADRDIAQLRAGAARDIETKRAEAAQFNGEAPHRRTRELQALDVELGERRAAAERAEADYHVRAVANSTSLLETAETRARTAEPYARDVFAAADLRVAEAERGATRTVEEARALAAKIVGDAHAEAQRLVRDAVDGAAQSTWRLRQELDDLVRQRDVVTAQVDRMMSGLTGLGAT